MLVITTREFRTNQKSYLDKIDEGVEVLIQRGKNRSYKIVPVAEDDTLMTKEEFLAKIDRSLLQYAEGKYVTLEPGMEVEQFLEKLCTE
jgi:antitoxin (DNA-binding transcriptional repressor) of toxin-antitoxin stability system